MTTRSGLWLETDKGDPRCRELADRHYTRQTPGHPMWTRPGWNMVLYLAQRNGRSASFCWFRPKWESGIRGTERKDGLRCVECAIFRNETRFLSSKLIVDAVSCLLDYTDSCPDVEATWFVDPPYFASRHYPTRVKRDEYSDLGRWCLSRRGLVVVCEADGASWLPFSPFRDGRTMQRGTSREVVWTRDETSSVRRTA